jgi:hypothetical protein
LQLPDAPRSWSDEDVLVYHQAAGEDLPGNLVVGDDSLPFQVTPAYDMLPMLWAPGSQGELIERRFAPAPLLPAMVEPWREAAGWAENFLDRVAADSRLSPEFGLMAREGGAVVRQLRRHVG